MTAKQVLRNHVSTMHGSMGRSIPKSWTMVQIAQWHAAQHHRHWTNHFHTGTNTGPDDRPRGWYTGEDAEPNR